VDFVSTTTGERAVSGISKAKERLDKRMLELLRAALYQHRRGCRADRGGGVDAASFTANGSDRNDKASISPSTSSTASSTRFGLGSGRSRFDVSGQMIAVDGSGAT
jgi:hypothetical protein